jgi:nucleoid-associated protein YgaU
MVSRYRNTSIFENDDLDYWKVFRNRFGKNEQATSITQYETFNIEYPTEDEILQLTFVTNFWTMGDRLHKYAEKHYGDPTYWWVIAWFNKKPSDAHFSIGDMIKIPLPLDQALEAYGL